MSLTEDYIKQLPEISLYKSILTQLRYVKSIVVDENRKPTEDEVEPVTFGVIAIKNFDEDDEPYRTMLINLYGDFERFSEE
ncbi:immunity protein Tsi6 family protein [Pedobacter sp. UYP24]